MTNEDSRDTGSHDDVVNNPAGQGRGRAVAYGGGPRWAQSKGIGIKADGTCGSVTYEDIVVPGEHGWRISHRKIQARKAPSAGN